jgi:hypothetical protein
MNSAQAHGPKIIRAKRNDEWESSKPDVEAFANIKTLKSMQSLGYTKVVVEIEFDIEALLTAKDASNA